MIQVTGLLRAHGMNHQVERVGAQRGGPCVLRHRPDESRAVSAPHGLTINEDFQGHLTDMQDSRPS